MTLPQFRCLSEDDQEYYLKTKAVAIDTTKGDEGLYTLFQIDGFYLEVLTDRKNSIIKSLWYHENMEGIARYLDKIDLASLYPLLNKQ